MTELLEKALAPHERMAEIRRLVRDASVAAVEAGKLQVQAEACGLGEVEAQEALWWETHDLWSRHDTLVTELLEHLQRSEEGGELAECEEVLTVSYGGRA